MGLSSLSPKESGIGQLKLLVLASMRIWRTEKNSTNNFIENALLGNKTQGGISFCREQRIKIYEDDIENDVGVLFDKILFMIRVENVIDN